MLRGERIPALAELSEIARLVRLKFNGIITDYPSRAAGTGGDGGSD